MTPRTILGFALLAMAMTPALASAGPVATSDPSYQLLGRVFPDPQGRCNQGPCSPQAQGNVPATTFVGYQEFVDGLTYMNSGAANAKVWARYLEVWTLDGKLGGNEGDAAKTAGTDEKTNFPGNNLGSWEFSPNAAWHSAGIPTLGADRVKSDVLVVRVTDEAVPDTAKQRVVLSLSIHGIERAGVEGGVRTIEDLVTAATSEKLDKPLLGTKGLKVRTPSYKEVLQRTIIYFTFPNPDGWRRGDVNDRDQNKGPGVFFQRYNGNGVDLNRDFPDIGYSFRPYSALSEPESRAWSGAFTQIKDRHGPFSAGDDLHGQPGADSFSYTLLPHGSHDYAKNERIRNAAQTINLVQQDLLSWSPVIQPNDSPRGDCVSAVLSNECYPMYGQTWGSVYDTINYTTTGALGDYMDSSIGLDADGIDNEMSFSHLDKNIAFDPMFEQMHVDGNKGLIYAHVAEILSSRTFVYPSPGRKGYVPNERVAQAAKAAPGAPAGTQPQADIDGSAMSSPAQDDSGPYAEAIFPFTVKEDATTFNGGMRIDATSQNVQGIDPVGAGQAAGPHGHNLKVQCKGCDQHVGVKDNEEWVTVAQDYNQSPLYLQAGLTVAVNHPQANVGGKPVEWRAVIDGGVSPSVNVHIEFSSGPATTDGATAGDPAPRLAAYNVASTDYWKKLDPYTVAGAGFEPVDANKLATDAGAQVPNELDTLILSDHALPGFSYPVPAAVPTPADANFKSAKQTLPCAYQDGLPHSPSCSETFDFKIPDGMESVSVTATPTNGGDITLTVVKVADGAETKVGGTDDGGGAGAAEKVDLSRPAAGDYRAYIDNWAAQPSADWWKATVHFDGIGGEARGDTKYTDEQYAAYIAKLRRFVEDGGNLVLTDGALRALPGLFPEIASTDVSRALSYTGQVAFTKTATTAQDPGTEGNTLKDPLAKNVVQPGARFNTGLRRQTYEPTPVGFAIQDTAGADASSAGVWQVTRKAFEAAGGRVVGTSVTSSPRSASTVVTQVTLGELKIGTGVVRVLGALLPQPTELYDHQEGLEPFAVTYTGSYLGENLTDWCRPGRNCVVPKTEAAAGDAAAVGGAGSGATACISSRTFKSAAAKGRGKGLRFSFKRSGTAPVFVDLFQVSKGRRVLRERLIGRFSGRKAISWNGAKSTIWTPSDGYYFARFRVKGASGFNEFKRIALRRKNGRWSRQRRFFGTETCSLVRQLKLSRMVFGGSNTMPLSASYLLARRARVAITMYRGKKVVRRIVVKRAVARKVVHKRLSKRGLKRGLYRVVIVAGSGKSARRETLHSRKI